MAVSDDLPPALRDCFLRRDDRYYTVHGTGAPFCLFVRPNCPSICLSYALSITIKKTKRVILRRVVVYYSVILLYAYILAAAKTGNCQS